MEPAHVDSGHNFGRCQEQYELIKQFRAISATCSISIRYHVAQSCLENSRWWLCPNQSNGAAKKHMYRIGEYCFLQIVHFYFLEIIPFDISFQIYFYQKKPSCFFALEPWNPVSRHLNPKSQGGEWRAVVEAENRRGNVCSTKRDKTKVVSRDG